LPHANTILIGQSHARSFARAAKVDGRPIRPFISRKGEEDGRGWQPGQIDADLLEAITAPDCVVLSTVGGNSHHAMALLASDRPFDFILSEAPALPLDPRAEYIPEKQVRAALRRRVISHTAQLIAVAGACRGRMFHSQSPPPAPDNDLFRRDLAARSAREPAPWWVRLKMWRLHSSIVAEICAEHGVTFLPIPPGVVDDAGFLRPEFFQNATHANMAYAQLVWAQLDAVL
jgi:hypothetical protein